MTQQTPVPLDRLIDIAECAAKKFRNKHHQDYDDLVQEIVLGVLQRQADYDPNKGSLETFVIGIAYQKAADRAQQFDLLIVRATTNQRSRIPYRYKPRDLDELESHGRLQYHDDDLRMQRLACLLDEQMKKTLGLLLQGGDRNWTCKQQGWSAQDFAIQVQRLHNIYLENRDFVKNNKVPGQYYPVRGDDDFTLFATLHHD